MVRLLVALPLALLVAMPAQAKPKRTDNCTSKAGKARIKTDGKVLQTLSSGQYRAYRHPGGIWTFCNGKGNAKTGFKSFSFDFGQANTGVALYSRPGKCLALQLRPVQAGGYPIVPTLDMRAGQGTTSSMNEIENSAPGARIVKIELSSTCLLGTAYVAADGGRRIELDPIIGPNTIRDRIALSPQATDTDLRAMKLDGDDVSWSDAGATQTKHYSGVPNR